MDKTISKKSYIEIAKSHVTDLLKLYETDALGLTEKEAKQRLKDFGLNQPAKPIKHNILLKFFSKFLNPLIIILLIIAIISYFFENTISSIMVSIMVLISVVLDFFQEMKSGREAEKLIEMVKSTATVYRNKQKKEIPIKEIVPGDIVFLSSGDIVPADIRLITVKDFFINRAILTGESFPVEKISEIIEPKNDSFEELKNIAFMGTSVDSGTATGIVIKTGINTKFGEISKKVSFGEYESSFEIGIKKYMWLMIKFTIILVLVIFLINALIKRHFLEALLFSLAVAVGLTPEMLPMLVTVNLSKGAISMSKKQVIVKRLNAIQNLGAMDILCTDKTGTITLGEVVLEKHIDINGKEDDNVLKLAYINSYYQTSLRNLLDKAILNHEVLHVQNYEKIDEMPFDFSRRIMSVVVNMENKHKLISKGAPESIIPRCNSYEVNGKIKKIDEKTKEKIFQQNTELNKEGFRVLAIAYKNFENTQKQYSKNDEKDLTFLGFTAFLDPPKPTAKKTIKELKELGINIVVLTGDSDLIAKKICTEVGINTENILTGDLIDKMDDNTLKNIINKANVYARLNPIQKERIIKLLRQKGHVVGYLGDGINDALSLKAADVGISVNNAADIAKESADIILLRKSLRVLAEGVKEGRKTFCNIIKYIKMGSSSNFGNMFSLTGASLFLPFLPMAPLQILLNNFLYDLSQVAIPTDNVDSDYLKKSRPWDIQGIRRFMLVFGPISSIFDFITFGVLLFIFKTPEGIFHTGWFWVSIITQTLVIHIIRTEKIPFIESKPSNFLILTSLIIICSALFIPFSPLDKYFGFIIPPPTYFIALFLIVFFYLLTVQFVKTWFVKKYGYM